MLQDLFTTGYVTGLLVSLPLGPMAILIIQRTANRDWKSGFYTALGVSVGDSIWALVAGFSVSFIITFLRENQSLLQIIAGIVLLFLGIYIFLSHPLTSLRKFKRKGTNPLQSFGSATLLTITNPGLVLAYIAVFASINITFEFNHISSPLIFMFAFFLGAMTWWIVVTFIINLFRHHFNLHILWWFNKISGAAIIIFVIISTIVIIFRGNPEF